MIRVLALAAALGGCTATWQRRALLAASDVVVLCDLSQTLWMSDGGRWDRKQIESNPMLGDHPSTGAVIFAGLASVAVNTAAYFLLPHRWSTAVNVGVLVVEGANVSTQNLAVPVAVSKGFAHHGCDVTRQL